MLHAVAELPDAAWDGALEKLADANLLFFRWDRTALFVLESIGVAALLIANLKAAQTVLYRDSKKELMRASTVVASEAKQSTLPLLDGITFDHGSARLLRFARNDRTGDFGTT